MVAALRSGDAPLVDALRAKGYELTHAPGHILDAVATAEDPTFLVADADLPGVFDALLRLRRLPAGAVIPVVLISTLPNAPDGSTTILRPVNLELFLARVEAAVRSRRRATLGGAVDVTRPSRSRPPPASRTSLSFGSLPGRESPGIRTTLRSRGAPSEPPPALTLRESRAARTRTPVTEWRPGQPDERLATPPTGLGMVHVPMAPQPQGGEVGAASLSQWLSQHPGPNIQNSLVPPEGAWSTVSNPSIRDLLQTALSDAGVAAEGSVDLDDLNPGDLDLDQLVPPELLEPLDPALDYLDDAPGERNLLRTPMIPPSSGASTGLTPITVNADRMGAVRRTIPRGVPVAQAVTPLSLDGDLSLSGRVLQSGGATVLGAAARGRATGTLTLRTPSAVWTVLLDAGHVLSLRGSRPEAHLGALLVAYGYIPQEAARLADVPLDVGVRGAALLAARGYVSPDGLALVLGRVAQEVFYDLLRLDDVEWELGALERSVAVPLPTRSLDALLVLGSRARITPALAYAALGGDGATVTLRAEASLLATLPLVGAEREAALAAQETPVAALVRSKGEAVLPALAALHWLQLLRAEGPSSDLDRHLLPPGFERIRLRALIEAATRHDHLALLGLSPWATPAAAGAALEARRAELDAIRARYGASEALRPLYAALDETASLLTDPASWERLVAALQRDGRVPD